MVATNSSSSLLPYTVRSSRTLLLHTALLQSQPDPPPKRSYKTEEARIRGSVRMLLDASLAGTSGVHNAKMHWDFSPSGTPSPCHLVSFSSAGRPSIRLRTSAVKVPGMKALHKLLQLLEAKPPKLYFVKATEEQLRTARFDAASICPGPLFPAPEPRLGYDNIGKRVKIRRTNSGTVIPPRHVRDGPKSAKKISDELETAVDAEVAADPTPPVKGPRPQIHTRRGSGLAASTVSFRHRYCTHISADHPPCLPTSHEPTFDPDAQPGKWRSDVLEEDISILRTLVMSEAAACGRVLRPRHYARHPADRFHLSACAVFEYPAFDNDSHARSCKYEPTPDVLPGTHHRVEGHAIVPMSTRRHALDLSSRRLIAASRPAATHRDRGAHALTVGVSPGL
ncbi:hypothetical protein C8T65DRAFT_745199 [Cerioporus squamosus]|nr:hypothetical protein C8T65DRAFT_745199 [Cerioporus squamosus]